MFQNFNCLSLNQFVNLILSKYNNKLSDLIITIELITLAIYLRAIVLNINYFVIMSNRPEYEQA